MNASGSSFPFSGRKVALAGGDRRHEYLARRLADLGGDVWLVRQRPFADGKVHHTRAFDEALAGSRILICPMPPFGPGGRIWSEDPADAFSLDAASMALLRGPALIFAGSFPPALAATATRLGFRLCSLGDLDELAVLNSIPTAEGAIMMALERTSVTIRGSKAVVLGCGRTGTTLVSTLVAMGARVTAIARRPSARARAIALGAADAFGFTSLAGALVGARFVFNTVPAPVLTAEGLSALHPAAVIIDIASSPGGTDFAAAANLGLSAVLAPALPGRVAPETSADYLAQVILRTASEHFGGGEGG